MLRPSSERQGLRTSSWYTDGARRPVLPTSAMTSKVKSRLRSRGASDRRQVLLHISRTKSHISTDFGRKVGHPTCNNTPIFKVKRSKVKVTRQINARVADATWWLMWNRTVDMSPRSGPYSVRDTACYSHSVPRESHWTSSNERPAFFWMLVLNNVRRLTHFLKPGFHSNAIACVA